MISGYMSHARQVATIKRSAMDQSSALSRHNLNLRYPWLGAHCVSLLSRACRAISHKASLDSAAMRPNGSKAIADTASPYRVALADTPALAARPGRFLA